MFGKNWSGTAHNETLFFAFPQSMANKIANSLWNECGSVCTQQEICRRLKELSLSQKKASTEAHQAFEPCLLLNCLVGQLV